MKTWVGDCIGTCGLGVVYGFNSNDPYVASSGTSIRRLRPRGAGFSVAGFLNTPKCKKAYEELAERFQMVYQSPVRRNRNTGNNFFFVIYDTEAQPPAKEN